MDTFYWQDQNLFTYLLGQKNLGEPFLDPLYKTPPFPAETLRQWGSLQPHLLQHLLLQDMEKKEKTDRGRDCLNYAHFPFSLHADTITNEKKGGGWGRKGQTQNHQYKYL